MTYELPDDIKTKVQPVLEARKLAFIFTLGILLICFAIGKMLRGSVLGMILVLTLYNNPLFQNTTLTAMGDAPLLFFLVLELYLSLRFLRLYFVTFRELKLVLLSMFTGIIVGLGVATKLNAILAVHIFIAQLVLLFLSKIKTRGGKIIVFFLLSCFFTFYIINPYIWPAPLKNTLTFVQHRQSVIKLQQKIWKDEALTTVKQRVNTVVSQVLFPGGAYTTFSLKNSSLPLDIIIFIFGLYVLARKMHSKSVNSYWFLAIWCFFLAAVTTSVLPLNWNRYFLPIVVPVIFIQSLAITLIFESLYTLLCKRAFTNETKNSLPQSNVPIST